VQITQLGGDKIERVLDRAPGIDMPIGGIKVVTASGWFAARPSGTEDIYKIYSESFRGEDHLRDILREAQAIVDHALSVDAVQQARNGRSGRPFVAAASEVLTKVKQA